jgi:hypothetical protein
VKIAINSVNDAPVGVIEVSPLSNLGLTVPGLNVISPDNQGACVVLDGSGSYDEEGDAIESYTWLVDGVPVGEGAVVEVCLGVGNREVTLLVDDGQSENNLGSHTEMVQVLSGCEAVEELIMVVNDSIVARENKRPFIATLKSTCAAFERGSTGAALNKLNAFENKTRSQIGKANPEVAAEWIRISREIVQAHLRAQNCGDCAE